MKIKGFHAWRSRNTGNGGQKPSFDPYNKAKKGSERNPRAAEFYSQEVEEYHRYSREKEIDKEKDDKKEQTKQSDSSSKSRSSSSNSQAIVKRTQSVMVRVVAATVGAVVIVNEYNAIVEREEAKALAARTATEVTWEWTDDYSSASASLFNVHGNLLKEGAADVAIVTVDATCNADGKITYTATVADEEDNEFSDIRIKTLPALGHDDKVVDQGDNYVVYECRRCHEKHEIRLNDPTEN